MKKETERRLLQIATATACLVSLGMGGLSIVRGPDVLQGISGAVPVDLDSHYRYLSGLLLGIGLAFLAALPTIERRTETVRILGMLVVIGGLGRLLSLIGVGVPSAGHLFGLGMELLVTPLIVAWQGRVAARYTGLTPRL
jgi:hypothetical protein